VGRQLVIDIDPAQTTTNTILTEITSQGTFQAALDTATDPSNDGTGIFSATGTVATTSGGTPSVIAGTDPNPLEAHGVFNTLLRLARALEDNDVRQIERTVALLDQDMERARFAQAETGASLQALEATEQRLQDEEVELRSALSDEIDVDLVEAISQLTTKQVAFEASLRSMGQIFQLSLLNFL
jgi:flagellin-like hook-associated protein FlgL